MRDDSLSEELIDRYLLGDLPEERQAEVEERAFQDRQYMERILAAESDLIDEYVRGGLSDSQRRMFDQRFLASAERRRKVEFAKALSSVISEGEVAEKESSPARENASFWSSFAAFFRGLSPAAGLSLAAASLLFVVGISWVVIETTRLRTQVARLQAEQQTQERDRQTLERQLAEEQARREELSSRLQTEQRERERSEESARQLEREKQEIAARGAQPTQAAQPSQPPVVSLALVAGLARGGAGTRPTLVLPPSARVVRLQIGIEPGDDYKSFSAELNTQAGQRVLTNDNLSARSTSRGRIITLDVPARSLNAGQYELALKGRGDAGTTDAIGYYYFEVLKK
ncbi:MAG: hypothetical protein ICV60_19860 [Pyrinomonadaceae bacterium]|nr:hypothetical protein [Pyrinomonadaceae bacterium]